MLQFIPFEDDWDVLSRLRPEDLIPFKVEMLGPKAIRTNPGLRRPEARHDGGNTRHGMRDSSD